MTSAQHRQGWSWPIALILFLSFLLNALPLWWGLPSYYGWAHDEIVPGEARESYKWPARYPPLHRYVLIATYSPILALRHQALQGLTGFEVDTVLYFAGRFLSVLLATLTVYVVYRCGRELGGRLASYFAALVAALMPPFVYYAKTVNLEAPYVFWFALSVLFFLKILRRHRIRDYLAFGALAALAICTKDQAYGLYLLSPVPMALSLARAGGGGMAAYATALFDRRILAMGFAAIGLFVLIHQIPWAPESFYRHVRTIVGPASADYRIYPMTLAGQAQMGWQSLEHVIFSMGAPFFLAAITGLALACRRRAGWKLSALALLAISYYLSFISVVGYNYVRFFLPVCLLLALPAGAALAELSRRPGRSLALRRVLVGAAILHAFLRAASIDLGMFKDVRYDVEQWLEARDAKGDAAGIDLRRNLPRELQVVDWHRLNQYECSVLEELNPRYVVINPVTAQKSRVFDRLMTGELNYARAAEFHRPEWSALEISGLFTNLNKIAREMVILERTGDDCMDVGGVIQELDELRRSNDAERRARLRDIIWHQDVAFRLYLDEEADSSMVAVGLTSDRWTFGVRPAGVAVRNTSSQTRTPKLRVLPGHRGGAFPLTVWIDDGDEARSHVFEGRRGGDIELTAVPPESERLFILWVDRAWQHQSRRLGVRIHSGAWIPDR